MEVSKGFGCEEMHKFGDSEGGEGFLWGAPTPSFSSLQMLMKSRSLPEQNFLIQHYGAF